MYKEIETFTNQGYFIFENALSKLECDEFKSNLKNIKNTMKIPYSDRVWGYGNLIDVDPFSKVIDNIIIKDFCKEFLKDYFFNHLMVNNKSAWIGPDVEWHQEAFNIETYAPGADPVKDWNKFIQFFIPLDDQNKENGCLKIVPNSHKLGLLKYEDIINSNLGHKRRVKFEEMQKAYEKYGIKDVELKSGDILIFNHLLIHGSGTNLSPFDRKAIVLQAQSKNFEKNDKLFEEATKKRQQFIIKQLNEKINIIENKNLYSAFKK